MKSEAQKEAKRLYKLFRKAFNPEYVHNISYYAREVALIAAKEMKNRALVWADPSEHDTIKDYFKQLRNAIKEL